MKRAWLPLIALVAVSGCQPTPLKPVYVDLNLIPTRLTPKPKSPDIKPVTLPAQPAAEAKISDKPARIVGAERTETSAQIRDLIRKEAQAAVEVLAKELREVLQPEFDAFALALQEGLTADRLARWQQYSKEIRPVFESYAKRREVLLVDRLLLDRPIPRGIELNNNEAEDEGLKARKSKLQAITTQIKDLDEAYERDIKALESKLGMDITDLEKQRADKLTKKSKELTAKAEAEARSLIRSRDDSMTSLDRVSSTTKLPPEPGAKASLSALPAQESLKRVPSQRSEPNLELELRRQLRIWLSLNHYELATSPGAAEDKTQEFIKWRADLTSPR